MPSPQFEISTGCVDVGWCDFLVRLGDKSWSCQASYIDHHPLYPLIHSAIDLYNHIFEEPIPIENAIWDSLAADEPGGIIIRATPEEQNVKIKIFHYPGEPLWPDPKKLPDISPVAEGLVDYWTYADAIFQDAARAVVRHGFTGLRNAWEPNRWDIDSHNPVFPVEHFLYLAALIKHRCPRKEMSLEDELCLLHELKQKYRS